MSAARRARRAAIPLALLGLAVACASGGARGPRSAPSAPAAVVAPPESRDEKLSIVELEPARGSLLQAGSAVSFRALLHYNLAVAPEGEVSLVYRDEDGPQVGPTVVVRRGSASCEIAASFVLAPGTRRVELIFTLVPGRAGERVLGTSARVLDSVAYEAR